MNEDEAKKFIMDNISVTRQKVIVAKKYILSHFTNNTDEIITSFLKDMDALIPGKIVLHHSVDPIPSLKKAVESLSWRLAACEAIWQLIHSNIILPASERLSGGISSIQWTTGIPGSGGHTSGFRLDELSILVPSQIVRPHSEVCDTEQPLSDPGLYLKELNILNLDYQVEDALREAVKCFRHELYSACLVMLGKASEGAWIELGLSLVKALPESSNLNIEKLNDDLTSPFIGIGKKVNDVIKLYERQDLLKPVSKRSGLKLQDLRNSVIWADTVRESRNSIHYGAEPSMSNSYEKVATLLIGAVPHLKIVYNIKSAADTVAKEKKS